MRIHIFQHESFESPAIIENWVKEKQHNLSFTRFYEDGKIPDADEIDWLIVMGGPMGSNDEDKYPWLKEEKLFIKKVIDRNKAVLGICLGSQLIAAALGSAVYRNREKEIGWMDVNLTGEARSNFLFSPLPDIIKVCQWHGDTFDLPEGAVLLAQSEACKNQAFIYNGKVVALQFHLEFTEGTVKDLIENCGEELVKDNHVQSEQEILQNISLLSGTNNLMLELLDRIEEKIL